MGALSVVTLIVQGVVVCKIVRTNMCAVAALRAVKLAASTIRATSTLLSKVLRRNSKINRLRKIDYRTLIHR